MKKSAFIVYSSDSARVVIAETLSEVLEKLASSLVCDVVKIEKVPFEVLD